MSSRRILLLLLSVIIAVALKGQSDEASSADSLPDSVYGDQIPVYPGASLRDAMGGTYSDELFGPPTAESLSWFFDIEESAEQVVAFYTQRLPNATRAMDDAETRFDFVPAGADTGESVTVRVGQGELQITEVVKPGKRAS